MNRLVPESDPCRANRVYREHVTSWTPRRRTAVAVAWAALLLVGVLVELRADTGRVAWWVSVAGTVPVLLAVRKPLAGTALVFAPLWVLTLRGTDAFSVGYLLAMITAVYCAGLLLRLGPSSAALATGLVSAVASSVQTVRPEPGDVVFPLLMIAGPWAAGRVHRRWRDRAEELRRLGDELARTRDDVARLAVVAERGEIARDLHDTLAQSLQVIIVNAEAAEAALDRSDGPATEAVRRIGREARRALDGARQTVSGLREDGRARSPVPPTGGDQGFHELEGLIDTMRSTGLEIRFDVDPTVHELPSQVDTTVFRMVQEALTNVVKHSAARSVEVAVRQRPHELVVEISDDGAPVGHPAGPGGYGIVGMRERVATLGGTFQAGPTADGFRVRAALPLARSSS